jgi:nucleotide-binding universal stress UspA family protein
MLKILLPSDGSERALDAVRHVVRLSQEGLALTVVLANVQEPTYLYEMVLAPGAELLEASLAAGMHALLGAQALLDAAGISYENEVGTGDPAHILLEIAERYGCDAIVMGARGVTGLREALLGSVSRTLLHDARIPVTVVRHPDPDEVAGDLAEVQDGMQDEVQDDRPAPDDTPAFGRN